MSKQESLPKKSGVSMKTWINGMFGISAVGSFGGAVFKNSEASKLRLEAQTFDRIADQGGWNELPSRASADANEQLASIAQQEAFGLFIVAVVLLAILVATNMRSPGPSAPQEKPSKKPKKKVVRTREVW